MAQPEILAESRCLQGERAIAGGGRGQGGCRVLGHDSAPSGAVGSCSEAARGAHGVTNRAGRHVQRAAAAAHRDQRHVHLRAARQGEAAARDERAALRRVAQVRRAPGDPGQFAAGAVQRRERPQQPLGVRVRGGVLEVGRAAELHDPARVHDRDPVAQLEQQRHVVGDEQDREAERLLELDDLGQDVALHHHVERGGRLVHDDDLGVGGQRHRDHDPLPHAARQLVRVAAQPLPRDADEVEQPERPSRAPRPSAAAGAPPCRR